MDSFQQDQNNEVDGALDDLPAQLDKLQQKNLKLTKQFNDAVQKYKKRHKIETEELMPAVNLSKICRTLGFKLEYQNEKGGVSAMIYHWYHGKLEGESSVAIDRNEYGELQIIKHNLHSGVRIDWIGQKLPCTIPKNLDIPGALKYISNTCLMHICKEKQLEELKKSYPEVTVYYTNNLSYISLNMSLLDSENKKQEIRVEIMLELQYTNQESPYPKLIDVNTSNKNMQERFKELRPALEEQLEPFRSMELADAYCLCFTEGDDGEPSTFRRRTLISM